MSIQNLRVKLGARLNGDSEAGFTLIELLVVMLILGILAAIALPAFFNQKGKANDAEAKETDHSLQVAMETCATDNKGVYSTTNCTQTKLHEIEPTIPATGGGITVTPATTGYTVAVVAEGTGNTFKIVNTAGALTYPCEVATSNRGGCPGTGTTAGTWG
jgi:type IV pilus assembly protein PilA